MKKNGFFVAAGILSILEAIGLIIAAIAMLGSLTLLNSGIEMDPSLNMTEEEFQIYLSTMRTMFIVFSIVFVVLAAIAIFNATVYLKNSGKSYDELHAHSGKIITVIVLSFFVGGLVCGAVGLVGYLNKPENAANASNEANVNQSTSNLNSANSEEISKKLQQLKDMRDNGIISDDEYQKAREDVLKKF